MCARSFSRKGQQLPDAKGHARPAHRSPLTPRTHERRITFSRIRRGPASPPRATARAETPRARRDAIGRGRRSARASAVARRSRPDGSRHARPLALRASPHGAREWVVRGTQAAAGVPGARQVATTLDGKFPPHHRVRDTRITRVADAPRGETIYIPWGDYGNPECTEKQAKLDLATERFTWPLPGGGSSPRYRRARLSPSEQGPARQPARSAWPPP